MKTELLKHGVIQSKNFRLTFDRDSESALLERNDNDTDYLKVYSQEQLIELRSLLEEIEYDGILVKEVTNE